MKKLISIVAIALVVAISCVSLIGCGNGDPVEIPVNKDFGAVQPTAEPTVAINADMSNIEMLLAGVENYYGAEYIASTSTGSIVTKVLGLPMTQFVKSDIIRQGSADGDYKQFSNNMSGSIGDGMLSKMVNIKIWEETALTKTGDSYALNYHSGNADDMSIDKTNYVLTFNEGKTFGETKKFDTVQAYQDAVSANPTKIWMYDITADTYLADQSTAPVYNETTKTYSFKIVADPDKSTTEYQKQMMYMLKEQSGMTPSEFAFETIALEVEMWENGFIKSLKVTESYYMVIAGIIKSTITLNSTRQISYIENEEGFTPSDLEAKMF